MSTSRLSAPAVLPDEAVGVARRSAGRLGGVPGNEILTSITAFVLTVLLLAEGVTLLRLRGLLTEHMFIGAVLLPPIALKLSSTGYRFVRYYTGSRAYREKGPPLLALRALAPLLVAATVVVFASGVWLMLIGHRDGTLLTVDKVSFIVWGGLFGIHFLSYLPRVLRSLRADWSAARRDAVPGSGLRAMLVAACLGGGAALALGLLSTITAWHGGQHHGG